jgi:predicted nucleic acid-binding protein
VRFFEESTVESPTFLRPHYLDASALVKLVVDEEHAGRIRSYFDEYATLHTFHATSVCVAEALSCLKVKYLYRKGLTQPQYLRACNILLSYLREGRISVMQSELENTVVFGRTITLAEKYGLDVSDAFQIVTVSQMCSSLGPERAPVLVTADNELAHAAQAEGLKVWNLLRDLKPLEM